MKRTDKHGSMHKSTPRYKKLRRLHTLFISVLMGVVFLAIFLGGFVYANWPAIRNEIAYATRKTVAQSTATPTPITSTQSTPEPIVEPAHIIINKIGVDAPINWNIPAEQTLEALNHGVAHLAGTAELGQIGNLFISGHSSDFVWKKNPYAAIFSLLPKLTVGDTIVIRENGKAYAYRVSETKIVDPNEVSVADPTTTPVLTLMTCYPIGTTKERFIVHAQLISSPDKPVSANSYHGSVPPIQFR